MTFSLVQFWERFKSAFLDVEATIDDFDSANKGLSYSALYTSKEDLDVIFSDPTICGTFLDIGCGDGHVVLYYALSFPDRMAFGIENQRSRFDFASLMKFDYNIKNANFINDDLLHCQIPVADVYFLYFPTGYVLDKILSSLYEEMRPFSLIVIESHGDLIKRIEKENWLSFSHEIPLSSPRHYPFARVYKRIFKERDSSVQAFQQTYQRKFILIEEDNITWIGGTYQMEWLGDDLFNLNDPPRTIRWSDVKKLMFYEDFDPFLRFVLNLREKGELHLALKNSFATGYIRKIIIEPTFMIELSSGQRLKWEEITSISKDSQICYDASYVF